MFKTNVLHIAEVESGKLEYWLNGLRQPGFGVKIVAQVVVDNFKVITTASVWKLGESLPPGGIAGPYNRTTIDEIPEDVSIEYPDADLPDHVEGV